jgi:hypothetical protein
MDFMYIFLVAYTVMMFYRDVLKQTINCLKENKENKEYKNELTILKLHLKLKNITIDELYS